MLSKIKNKPQFLQIKYLSKISNIKEYKIKDIITPTNAFLVCKVIFAFFFILLIKLINNKTEVIKRTKSYIMYMLNIFFVINIVIRKRKKTKKYTTRQIFSEIFILTHLP